MLKLLMFVFAVPLFAPTYTFAASRAQENRFTQWLDILERPLSSSDKKTQVAKALIEDENSRIAAFKLQALGRVYSDWSREFEDIRVQSKRLEDVLGAVDKWKSLRNEDKLEKANEELAALVKDKKWMGDERSPRIRGMRDFLSKFDWPSEERDKAHVLKRLIKQLQRVNETEYDMSRLEEGNGVHELRRELRWFLIESQAVNGLITFKREKLCSRHPMAQSKYGELPENQDLEIQPCRISQCLFLDVVDLVKQIGAIKDEAEKRIGNKGEDQVPKDLRHKAERQYQRLVESSLLPELITEVKACAH